MTIDGTPEENPEQNLEEVADGGSAFPLATEHLQVYGMSLRQWYAGQMAPVVWAEMCQTFREEEGGDIPLFDELASDAFRIADAMIKEEAEEAPTAEPRVRTIPYITETAARVGPGVDTRAWWAALRDPTTDNRDA